MKGHYMNMQRAVHISSYASIARCCLQDVMLLQVSFRQVLRIRDAGFPNSTGIAPVLKNAASVREIDK